MKLARHVGGPLLLVGGVLEVARLFIFGIIAVVIPEPVPTLIYGLPSACLGVGLIAIGVSIRGRGRLSLMIAGALDLAAVVVNIAQMATDSPLGPWPSQLALFVAFAAIVVAAALLLSNPSLHGSTQWVMVIPAAGVVLFVVCVYVPPLGLAGFALLPGIGFAIAGVVLLRRTRLRPLTAD